MHTVQSTCSKDQAHCDATFTPAKTICMSIEKHQGSGVPLCISRAGREPKRSGGSFASDGFPASLVTKEVRWLHANISHCTQHTNALANRRLGLLLASAAVLLFRLLGDAEAWATPIHIFSPPCLNVLALVRWDGDSFPFRLATPRNSPPLSSWRIIQEMQCAYAVMQGRQVRRQGQQCKGWFVEIETKRGHNAFIGDKTRWKPRYDLSYSVVFLQAANLGC